ncbi:MAG: helicase RepA family protein [Chloroflexota bacterium]|nr:helicase RepA family protein [Chloroflexota bacterium]
MTEGDARGFRPLSLDELFALELPEVEWAVDGLLPLGAAGLLSAREKAGKGLLAIDLCASVALGEPFLDRAVREGSTVYAAAEEHVRDVRARVAARVGDRRDAPLYVLPLDGSTGDRLKLDDPAAMQRLWDMVGRLEPVVVVLDTLREFHDRKEDSSDEMGPLLRPVRQLAHQTNTTVVVNHHQNKLGGFRGSTAIRAAFDLEWAFARAEEAEGDEGPPRGALRVEGRHGPRKTLQIRLGEGMRWEPATALAAPPEPTIRERILVHLRAVDGWRTALEIAAGLGVADKTAQNALAKAVREVPRPLAVEGEGTNYTLPSALCPLSTRHRGPSCAGAPRAAAGTRR